MNRRTFLASSAALVAAACSESPAPEAAPEAPAQAEGPVPIIDTHVHLYDSTRPGGAPWPPASNELIFRKNLPDKLREVTEGLNVVGAIKVEASPLFEDNQWVLDVIEQDSIMVGMIGNLEPDKPEFAGHLENFGKNPLYLGIRYGYLWGRDLREMVAKAAFIDGLKLLAEHDMTLDTANPSVRALEDIVELTDKVPNLRVVLDHLPKLEEPPPGPERDAYHAAMTALGSRPNVFVKVSAVLRNIDGRVPDDVEVYRAKLDEMWTTFGDDRVLYGSDWPNSEPLGLYPKVLGVVQRYASEKSREQQEKYFWKNSVAAYRWKKRAPDQPEGA